MLKYIITKNKIISGGANDFTHLSVWLEMYDIIHKYKPITIGGCSLKLARNEPIFNNAMCNQVSDYDATINLKYFFDVRQDLLQFKEKYKDKIRLQFSFYIETIIGYSGIRFHSHININEYRDINDLEKLKDDIIKNKYSITVGVYLNGCNYKFLDLGFFLVHKVNDIEYLTDYRNISIAKNNIFPLKEILWMDRKFYVAQQYEYCLSKIYCNWKIKMEHGTGQWNDMMYANRKIHQDKYGKLILLGDKEFIFVDNFKDLMIMN